MKKPSILHHFINIPSLELGDLLQEYKCFKTDNFNREIDKDTTILPDIILGKQAEFLFEQYLDHCDTYNIIAANYPVQGSTRTLGELDYLVQNNDTKQYLHLELACKFYLLKPDHHFHLLGQWVGPNLKDTLLDKVTKFKDKQFPLLYTPEGAALLKSILPESSRVVQQYCIKSTFFVPLQYDIALLPSTFTKCIAGSYVTYKDFKPNINAEYAVPNKRQWLLPESHISQWFDGNTIAIVIKKSIANKKAPLVYEKVDGTIKKLFITWW